MNNIKFILFCCIVLLVIFTSFILLKESAPNTTTQQNKSMEIINDSDVNDFITLSILSDPNQKLSKLYMAIAKSREKSETINKMYDLYTNIYDIPSRDSAKCFGLKKSQFDMSKVSKHTMVSVKEGTLFDYCPKYLTLIFSNTLGSDYFLPPFAYIEKKIDNNWYDIIGSYSYHPIITKIQGDRPFEKIFNLLDYQLELGCGQYRIIYELHNYELAICEFTLN